MTAELEIPSHEPYLRITRLTKRYGPVTAMNALSLDMRREEFLTLLGESGSGKTTMLMAVAGFNMADSGEILLEGRDITFMPPSKRDVGVVFQNYALFPHMTIFENVAYPLRIRKRPKAEVAERVSRALELVRLPDVGERHPAQLSGGQQQRIALARAVVYEPRILLMDEPLGALDKKLRDYMQLEIKRLQRLLKMTVIYVTHDQSEALTMSDRIAVMRGGVIEQIGTPRELYVRPANRFVADFIGEACFLEAKRTAVNDAYCTAEVAGHRIQVVDDGKSSADSGLTLMVRPEAIELLPDATSPPPAGRNSVRGTITEAIYNGESTHYILALADGQPLRLKQHNTRASQQLAVGSEVAVAWDVEDTIPVR